MSIDVSILCPTIRTHLLPAFYESAEKACKNNSFEVVFISPFEKPEYFNDKSNVKWFVDHGCPSRATQIGALECEGTFVYNTVDDGLFVEGCIDAAIDQFTRECNPKDIINMRYRESENASKEDEFPEAYWSVWGIPNLAMLAGVQNNWRIALHFFMKRDFFCELGGMDCRFEYVNHGAHDLMFRAQHRGSWVHLSKVEGLLCTHVPERTGDHGPIHDAQLGNDEPLFNQMWNHWSSPSGRGTENVDMYQYKEFPEVWERRFPEGVTKSYEELSYE
jgi:hypothetical protein